MKVVGGDLDDAGGDNVVDDGEYEDDGVWDGDVGEDKNGALDWKRVNMFGDTSGGIILCFHVFY